MLAMTFGLRLQGPVDTLKVQLDATRSSSRRATLIRKLALCHSTRAIDAIIPHLAGEGRVRRAAVEALVMFGEDARQDMLDVLGNPHRREIHPAALVVLAGILAAAAPARVTPATWRQRLVVEG